MVEDIVDDDREKVTRCSGCMGGGGPGGRHSWTTRNCDCWMTALIARPACQGHVAATEAIRAIWKHCPNKRARAGSFKFQFWIRSCLAPWRKSWALVITSVNSCNV